MFRRLLYLSLAAPLVLLAACGQGELPEPELLEFENFQPASVVIGQPDFTSTGAGLSASQIDTSYGKALVHDGRLFLPDYSNDRVLVFDQVPTTNGASADFVLGQPNFSSDAPGTGASQVDGPASLEASGDRLLLAEFSNSRIIIWNELPTTSGESADVVVGQSAFGTNGPACTSSGLTEPESLSLANGKLIVPDAINNRVLIWNQIPSENGEPADLVLGQESFDACLPNKGATTTAATLNYPSDTWSDGQILIVADASNNRVLIWNSFPQSNGEPADIVLGQASMTDSASAAGASGMFFPYFITSNGRQLFVTDSNNERVLIWDEIPEVNGAPADRVLGQADFDNTASNDDDQDGVDDGVPSARVFKTPTGLELFEDKLIVTDGVNRRYLVFEAP